MKSSFVVAVAISLAALYVTLTIGGVYVHLTTTVKTTAFAGNKGRRGSIRRPGDPIAAKALRGRAAGLSSSLSENLTSSSPLPMSIGTTTVDRARKPDKKEARKPDKEEEQRRVLPTMPILGADIIERAREFVADRRTAYRRRGRGRDWGMRGVGYLHEEKGVLLAGVLRRPNSAPVGREQRRHVVEIHNVHPNRSTGADYCHLLTIWVRVNGPEILAGSARAVRGGNNGRDDACHWEFTFDLAVAGSYAIDSKVLLWNGRAPVNGAQCRTEGGDPPVSDLDRTLPIHAGFKGFKLYFPELACCEACSRMRPHCKHWATPAFDLPNPDYKNNGCELWFQDDVPPDVIPISRIIGPHKNVPPDLVPVSELIGSPRNRTVGPPRDEETVGRRRRLRLGEAVVHAHGPPHDEDTVYFLGCGWSFWFALEYPCISGNLDDRVYIAEPQVNFTPTEVLNRPSQANRISSNAAGVDLPLCPSDAIGEKGRWVREPWPNVAACPKPFRIDPQFNSSRELGIDEFRKRLDIAEFDGTHPHCWHRDDLTLVGRGCFEPNCRFIRRESQWHSSLREKRWFGVWRRHDCDYIEFSDRQLQQCVDALNIVKFEAVGDSITQFLSEYVQLRTKNLALANVTEVAGGGITVKIDTFYLLHLAANSNAKVAEEISNIPSVAANERHFFVTGYYLSSEREPFTHVDRMVDLNDLVAPIAVQKGIEIVNVHDLSAAFAYDTAAQFDGMHIIGPPMKMAITKMFHYLCKDVVEGSRV